MKRRMYRIIIAVFLLLGGEFFSLLTYSEKLSILVYPHDKTSFIEYSTDEITEGKIIKGRVKAREDNLGIIAIRFNTFGRINADALLFRIKSDTDSTWRYQNSYKVDQFQPNQLFPFGFPKIPHSKNELFEFEIVSEKGVAGNAVALSPLEPVVATKYDFSTAKYSPGHIFKKLLNSFFNVHFLLSSVVYFLPLLFYILFLLYVNNMYFINIALLCCILLVIGVDVTRTTIISTHGPLLVITLGVLLVQSMFLKMKSRYFFLISLLLIMVLPFLIYFKKELTSERLAIWSYFLSVLGLVKASIEYRFER